MRCTINDKGVDMRFFLISLLFSVNLIAENISFDANKWLELSFNNIPTNKVQYSDKGIKVAVASSASPLVFKFNELRDIKEFEINLRIDGNLKTTEGNIDFEEDSYFRLGLVATGENHLGVAGRLLAPKWVQQLFSLAPDGVGLDKIYFYNLGNEKELISKERIHPQSKYMYEHIIDIKGDRSDLSFKHRLQKQIKAAALWISIDGDNTKSDFEVNIKSIIFK